MADTPLSATEGSGWSNFSVAGSASAAFSSQLSGLSMSSNSCSTPDEGERGRSSEVRRNSQTRRGSGGGFSNLGGRRLSGGMGRRASQGRRASGEVSEIEQQQSAAMARELEHVQQQQRRMSLERGRRQDIVMAGYTEGGEADGSPPRSNIKSPQRQDALRSERRFEHAEQEPFEWGGSGEAPSVDRRNSGAGTADSTAIGSLVPMVDTNLANISGVVDDMSPGGRRRSAAKQSAATAKGPAVLPEPGSPSHAWDLNGPMSPPAPGSPTERSSSATRSNGIFSHKGVWVRPSSIGEVLSMASEEERFPPLEEHAGFIDARAGIDVAHAILAFEFIDRINDEVLCHYLPLIDDELGKPLNLRHERGRLRTPVENADASDASVRSTPVIESSEIDGGEESRSTSYYDQGEQVSGYEGSCGGSVGGDPVGDEDLRRSRPDSRQQSSRGSASHFEEYTEEGSEGAGYAWDAECSAAAQLQGSSSRDSRSEAPLKDEYMDEVELVDFGADKDCEEDPSSRPDVYGDACGDVRSSESAGQSFGDSSEPSPDITATATSVAPEHPAAPDVDFVQMRSSSQQSETPDFMEKAHSAVLQSGGPSTGSHGFGSKFLGGSNSAESQVWPHACSILPKAASQARSTKLKAVDSIPDPVAHNMFDVSASSLGEVHRGSTSALTMGHVAHPGGHIRGQRVRRSTLKAARPLEILLPDVNANLLKSPLAPEHSLPLSLLHLASDPGIAAAGTSAVYGPGACRVRRSGDKDAVDRATAKLQRRVERRARDSARAAQRSSRGAVGRVPGSTSATVVSAGKCDSNIVESGVNALAVSAPTATAQSGGPNTQISSSRDAAGAVGHRGAAPATADARGVPGDSLPGGGSPVGPSGQTTNTVITGRHLLGLGHEKATGCLPVAEQEQTWPPRRPSSTADPFEDLLTMHLRGDSSQPAKQGSPSDRRQRRANSTCPFSHDRMESSSAVDLRCGHRFALARLGVARRAARVCCSAGFAIEDALICPLCGDQDITSKPGASKMLKTYSTNTDAYLGDLRKDWRRPLHLPMQSAGGIEANRPVSARQAPDSASPSQRAPAASTPSSMAAPAPIDIKKPTAPAPGSARPSSRSLTSAHSSWKSTIATTA